MDDLAGGDLGFDGVEKADELLMPMALHAPADDLAFEHVEGGEEGRGAVADIVVGHGAAAPLLDREPWLGAVEGLDLAHMGNSQVKTFGSGFHGKSPWVASYPRSEPARMTRPVSDAASNSHPVADLVGYTNIPLAAGEGSGGRDHSFLRLFKPGQIAVRSPGSTRADQTLEDWKGSVQLILRRLSSQRPPVQLQR
jgi:hypothetical protein